MISSIYHNKTTKIIDNLLLGYMRLYAYLEQNRSKIELYAFKQQKIQNKAIFKEPYVYF